MIRIWDELITQTEGMNGMRKQRCCAALLTVMVILLTAILPCTNALAEKTGVVT